VRDVCLIIYAKKKTGAYSENFWTSGISAVIEEQSPRFTWDSTGRSVWQYSSWASGQPNDGSKGCIILSHADGFKWDNVECQPENLRYICEKKGKSSILYSKLYFLHNNFTSTCYFSQIHWMMKNLSLVLAISSTKLFQIV